MTGYAVIDTVGGWLVNLVVWDGNTETWSPPEGTYAIKLDEINITALPSKPSEE